MKVNLNLKKIKVIINNKKKFAGTFFSPLYLINKSYNYDNQFEEILNCFFERIETFKKELNEDFRNFLLLMFNKKGFDIDVYIFNFWGRSNDDAKDKN